MSVQLPTDWREVISQAMMSNVAGEDATLGDSTAEVEDNRVAGDQPVAQTLVCTDPSLPLH